MPVGGARAGLFGGGLAIPDAQNLQNDWNAASFGLADGATISSAWQDDRGNADASVLGDPVYETNGPNGEPTVILDGSGDAFDTGIDEDTDTNHSYYFVARADATGDYLWGASNNSQIFVGNVGGAYYSSYADGFIDTGTFSTGSYQIHSLIAEGSNWTWYVNGSQVATVSYTGAGLVGQSAAIGARHRSGGSFDSPLDGQVARILRYTSGHDSTTRQEVESHLNGIYGVY